MQLCSCAKGERKPPEARRAAAVFMTASFSSLLIMHRTHYLPTAFGPHHVTMPSGTTPRASHSATPLSRTIFAAWSPEPEWPPWFRALCWSAPSLRQATESQLFKRAVRHRVLTSGERTDAYARGISFQSAPGSKPPEPPMTSPARFSYARLAETSSSTSRPSDVMNVLTPRMASE